MTEKEAAKALQSRLTGLGYPCGAIDGIVGLRTLGAMGSALDALEDARGDKPAGGDQYSSPRIPIDWMPAVPMKRIICHWTAGAHKASALDREHYHILIEADGNLVRGTHSIAANVNTGDGDYAAHTRGLNTGSIGVSLCCMAGAIEQPFNAGSAPMTKPQWDALSDVVAQLCRRYSIPVTPETVLSHAEVQGTLGIKQSGKWDIARLVFDPGIKGAKAIGDRLREEVLAKL